MNWKLSVILLTISVMACGMPVNTQPEPKISIKTPALETTQTPIRSDAESTARACGSLWIREGAGVEYQKMAWALKGDTLYLTGEYKEASDGGKWMKVLDRDGLIGWVNVRYLCGGENE